MKKLLIKWLAGLLPRARGAFARPAGQQTHTAQLGKVLYFFLASDKTNRPADKFYSSDYFQVQVCWCGGDRRELSETSKSAALQNSLFLQHPLTKVVTKIHQHSWNYDRPLPGLIKFSKKLSHIFNMLIARDISTTNLFRFPLLNLQSLIVLNTKSCRWSNVIYHSYPDNDCVFSFLLIINNKWWSWWSSE